MTKKNEFESLVKDLDEKFKQKEAKIKKLQAIKKKHIIPKKDEPSRHEKKMKDDRELQKFRFKEKLTYSAIVFVIGQLMLIPVYMKHPQEIAGIFIIASLSLGVICIAVIDFG